MRKIIIMAVLLSQVLALGVAMAWAGDYRHTEDSIRVLFMMEHINAVCDSNLTPNDIVYVGEVRDTYWYYTPFNETCQYTGQFSNVWSLPVKYVTAK